MMCSELFIGNTLHPTKIPVRVLKPPSCREGGEHLIVCKTQAQIQWSIVCAVVAVPMACMVVLESPNKMGLSG